MPPWCEHDRAVEAPLTCQRNWTSTAGMAAFSPMMLDASSRPPSSGNSLRLAEVHSLLCRRSSSRRHEPPMAREVGPYPTSPSDSYPLLFCALSCAFSPTSSCRGSYVLIPCMLNCAFSPTSSYARATVHEAVLLMQPDPIKVCPCP